MSFGAALTSDVSPISILDYNPVVNVSVSALSACLGVPSSMTESVATDSLPLSLKDEVLRISKSSYTSQAKPPEFEGSLKSTIGQISIIHWVRCMSIITSWPMSCKEMWRLDF